MARPARSRSRRRAERPRSATVSVGVGPQAAPASRGRRGRCRSTGPTIARWNPYLWAPDDGGQEHVDPPGRRAITAPLGAGSRWGPPAGSASVSARRRAGPPARPGAPAAPKAASWAGWGRSPDGPRPAATPPHPPSIRGLPMPVDQPIGGHPQLRDGSETDIWEEAGIRRHGWSRGLGPLGEHARGHLPPRRRRRPPGEQLAGPRSSKGSRALMPGSVPRSRRCHRRRWPWRSDPRRSSSS